MPICAIRIIAAFTFMKGYLVLFESFDFSSWLGHLTLCYEDLPHDLCTVKQELRHPKHSAEKKVGLQAMTTVSVIGTYLLRQTVSHVL